jgi:hypothetical protein
LDAPIEERLAGPALSCSGIDQIDAIVTASYSLARAANSGAMQEQKEAQSIVDALAQGLMELYDKQHRAVTVISCLEATWKVLEDRTSVPMEDRYRPPLPLQALSAAETARALVAGRLETAYAARGFELAFRRFRIRICTRPLAARAS